MATIGLDLGGTNLRGVVLGEHGQPMARRRIELGEARTFEEVVATIGELVTLLRDGAGASVDAVGLGVAGWVRPSDGLVIKAPNLGWEQVPLRAELQADLGLPILPMNDLAAITYGEWKAGAARGLSDVLVVFAGTGVGSSMVIHGSLHEGAGGYSGEIGHFPVRPEDGGRCGCGRLGCMETIAGGRFIQERVVEGIAAGRFAAVAELAGGSPVHPGHVDQAAARGDQEALALWREVSVVLGGVLAGVLNVLDPQALVLGGGVMEGCPTLRAMVVDYLTARLLDPIAEHLQVLEPALGPDAGMIGAALRAMDELT